MYIVMGMADSCNLRCFQACSILGLDKCFQIRCYAIFALPSFNEMGSNAELGPTVSVYPVTYNRNKQQIFSFVSMQLGAPCFCCIMEGVYKEERVD